MQVHSDIKFNRIWSMPNKNTFKIKPIKELLERYITPFDEVIVLRVKTTEEERCKVLSKAMALVGEPYNYTFFFNTKEASYCTDIVGKAYSEIGVDLNKDKLTTSVYDLLISKDTYISYYYYMDSKGIKHFYYLV